MDKRRKRSQWDFHKRMKGDEDVAHIGIRLDEREKDQITELAQKKDLTLSQIVRKLLRDYLNKEDEKG